MTMKDTHFTIKNPGRDEIQAAVLKSALKLTKAGIMPSRGLTKTKLMAKASAITGVKYKRTEIDVAIDDLNNIVQDHIESWDLLNSKYKD
jgi:hypothetical protein|tara:strand:- start:318 stop:587 length:270 start_codon:yes stop_codon:yes gene_type:complete